MNNLDPKSLTSGLKGLKKGLVVKKSSDSIQKRRGFSLKEGESNEIDKYQQYIIDFNIEKWLEVLKNHTFETSSVELTIKHAEEFIDCYESLKKNVKVEFTEYFKTLEKNLDLLMETFGKPCFVKTSSRSAKDYANVDELKDMFLGVLSKLEKSENGKLIAISYASMELLKMNSGSQVLNNFINSERIWHDMKLALAQKEHWNESLVIRRWTNIEPDMEFRCFVVNGVLTCFSQYRHLIHFPRLVSSIELLSVVITQYFNSDIKPLLENKFDKNDYILDIAIELSDIHGKVNIMKSEGIEQKDIVKVWVVEVNPFFETTDGCLFSWSHDLDTILNIKVKEPVVRVRKKPSKGASSLIYGVWKDMLDNA